MNISIRGPLILALLSWTLHGCALLAATTDAVQPAFYAADIAREKDVVWLSLVTAIVAMLFSAWLVRQMVAQSVATVAAINALARELHSHPCLHELDSERRRPRDLP